MSEHVNSRIKINKKPSRFKCGKAWSVVSQASSLSRLPSHVVVVVAVWFMGGGGVWYESEGKCLVNYKTK